MNASKVNLLEIDDVKVEVKRGSHENRDFAANENLAERKTSCKTKVITVFRCGKPIRLSLLQVTLLQHQRKRQQQQATNRATDELTDCMDINYSLPHSTGVYGQILLPLDTRQPVYRQGEIVA